MSAPETLDAFDHFLSIDCPVEKYVSLGLAFEEIIEKLRTKGSEPERQALGGVLELPQARAHLIELGAQRLLDAHAAKLEEAFADNPRKWGERQPRLQAEPRRSRRSRHHDDGGPDGGPRQGRPQANVVGAAGNGSRRGRARLRALRFRPLRIGMFDPAMMKLAAR